MNLWNCQVHLMTGKKYVMGIPYCIAAVGSKHIRL